MDTASTGWVNVKAYGALGNGSHDDTAAITAAIAAIPAAGGTLYFPAGTYKTAGGFTLANNCTVMGEGSGGILSAAASNVSLVTCTSATASLFTVTADVARFESIALRNDAVTTPSEGAAVTVNGSGQDQRVDYDNVVVTGFYIGIDVRNGSHWTMHGCTLIDPVQYCLKIANASNQDEGDFSISDCWFQSTNAGVPAAVRLEGAGGGKIVNSRINGFDQGFVHGLDLFVLDAAQTGEIFLTQVSIVGFSGDGFHAAYEGNAGAWTKIMLTGCLIVTYNATTTTRAVRITGQTLGDGPNFKHILITGCLFAASAGDRAAVLLTNCDETLVTANYTDGVYFSSVLENVGPYTGVVDASGSVGNGVAVMGIPAIGYLPVAGAATTAEWVYPSWLAWAAYGDAVRRTPSLRGYWRLGEPSGTSAADTGPNGITGTYANTPTLAQTGALTGDADTAVLFTAASSEYVDLGTDSDLDMTTELTVECWWKGTANGALFCRIHEGDTGDPLYDTKGYRLVTSSGKAQFTVGDGGTNYIAVDSAASVNDGAWHHLVATRSGDAMRIFVDGAVSYDSPNIASNIGSMSAVRVALIGARPVFGTFGRDLYITGTLDEVAVYSRALEPVEVLMHYQIGIAA